MHYFRSNSNRCRGRPTCLPCIERTVVKVQIQRVSICIVLLHERGVVFSVNRRAAFKWAYKYDISVKNWWNSSQQSSHNGILNRSLLYILYIESQSGNSPTNPITIIENISGSIVPLILFVIIILPQVLFIPQSPWKVRRLLNEFDVLDVCLVLAKLCARAYFVLLEILCVAVICNQS